MVRYTVIGTALLMLSAAATADGRFGRHGPFEGADADNDGTITREEYVANRANQFASRDRNGDGYIDDADTPKRLASRPQAGERLGAMREQMDANGDGKVSKEEFTSAPTPVFDQADTDGNAVLDAKEIEAAKAKMKETASEFRKRRAR